MPKELVVREPSLKKRLHGKRLAASRMCRFGRIEQAKAFCAEHRIEFPPFGRYDFLTDPPRVQQTAGPLGQKTPEQIHAELVKLSGGGVAAPQTNTSLDTEAIMKDVDTSSLDPFRQENLVAPKREAQPTPTPVLESPGVAGPLGGDIPLKDGVCESVDEGWGGGGGMGIAHRDDHVQPDPVPEPQIVTQANDLPPAAPTLGTLSPEGFDAISKKNFDQAFAPAFAAFSGELATPAATPPAPVKAIRRARINKFCINPRLAGIRFTEPPYEYGSMFINRVGLQLDEMVDVVVEQGSGAAAIYAEVRRRV